MVKYGGGVIFKVRTARNSFGAKWHVFTKALKCVISQWDNSPLVRGCLFIRQMYACYSGSKFRVNLCSMTRFIIVLICFLKLGGSSVIYVSESLAIVTTGPDVMKLFAPVIYD